MYLVYAEHVPPIHSIKQRDRRISPQWQKASKTNVPARGETDNEEVKEPQIATQACKICRASMIAVWLAGMFSTHCVVDRCVETLATSRPVAQPWGGAWEACEDRAQIERTSSLL